MFPQQFEFSSWYDPLIVVSSKMGVWLLWIAWELLAARLTLESHGSCRHILADENVSVVEVRLIYPSQPCRSYVSLKNIQV